MDKETYRDQVQKIKTALPGPLKKTAEITVPFYLFHRIMFTGMTERLKSEHDLTNSEIDVLGTLYTAEGQILSPTRLYQRFLFSSGGMTKVLKKLEDKAYIERIENEQDRRSKLVKLTDRGSALLSKAMVTALSFEKECLSALSEEEQSAFLALLEKLLQQQFKTEG
jgi:DNA-binding MarR family transcriptional regulator